MKRVLFVILFAAMFRFMPAETAQAAVATIELQTEAETIRVDEEFEVILLIEAQPAEGESAKAATIGDFEAHLIYDPDVMEFVTAPSCIMGGAGMLRISDMGASASEGSRKYVMRFRALERGTGQVSMYSMPLVYTFGGTEAMSVSSNQLELTVLPAKDASNNASLSALKVSPGKLSPAFATTIREYEVSIPYESERIIVSALTEDANATVSVNGSTGLKLGRNTVLVTVTAEDGTEKRYYLYVTREEKAAEPTKAPEPVVPEGFEAGIHANENNGVITLSYGGEFTVAPEDGSYIAPTGYEETVLYVDGVKIKGYIKRDTPESDYFVLVLQNELGESGYYRYDRKEQTLQRFDETKIEIRQVVEEDNSPLYDMIEKYKSNQVFLLFLLAMFIGITVLLLMLLLHQYKRYSGNDEDLDD